MKPERRFEVWDELGKLRTFYSMPEAIHFCHENMFIVKQNRLTPVERLENMQASVGEALF